ncbi:integrase core domain-containing protein (plasmid) [Nitrobacter sp. NHB1]|uniref:integrase core domain-containing protein n=1 Tax=Nitrobacter sp. NHB1 TaxID=3119830 RepID=UPI002FFE8777
MCRVRSIGIRDRPTSPRSPWQNAYAERLIGSIRRECVDHIVVFGERHLCHVLLSYVHELLQSCFITHICLCDWREEALLIWMRSRGVIWVLPRATNEALSRRFAER